MLYDAKLGTNDIISPDVKFVVFTLGNIVSIKLFNFPTLNVLAFDNIASITTLILSVLLCSPPLVYLILEYANACAPVNVCFPEFFIRFASVLLFVSSAKSVIYLLAYFTSASSKSIVTPPIASIAAITASKFTVIHSVIFKSKFVFRAFIAPCAPPYAYACVTLSNTCFPFSSNNRYVSLYTDISLISFVF